MTHFIAHANVMVPRGSLGIISEDDVIDQIAGMFAPYNENTDEPEYLETVEDEEFGSYQYNPDSKWDWYVIGGRFDGAIDDRKGVTSYMGGNLASAEDMHSYASKSLEQVGDIASDFLDEYTKIARNFGTIPPVPDYKDVLDGNMTEEDFRNQRDQLQESTFFKELVNLIRAANTRVEDVSGIDPCYLGQFSSTPIDIIRNITLEDDEKIFIPVSAFLSGLLP